MRGRDDLGIELRVSCWCHGLVIAVAVGISVTVSAVMFDRGMSRSAVIH